MHTNIRVAGMQRIAVVGDSKALAAAGTCDRAAIAVPGASNDRFVYFI
jgi:hypothetical protein